MLKGDLVRCRDFRQEDSEWNEVGVIVEYESWEKIATVLMQKSGEVKRIPASHIQLIKRAPQNKKKLKELAEKT